MHKQKKDIDEDCDMIFKVIIIGDSSVGKTNILSRFIKDEFNLDTKATVGVEFGSKTIKYNDSIIKIQIWDTAGHERYKSITNAYYKGSKGALIVYDISRRETFASVDRWIGELKTHGDAEVSMLLIGNKTDLQDHRQIEYDKAIAKAEQYKIAYCETSALQAVNIQKAFTMMIEEMYKKIIKTQTIPTVPKKTIYLDSDVGEGRPIDDYIDKDEEVDKDKEIPQKKGCCS